jgi:hypothetical protein
MVAEGDVDANPLQIIPPKVQEIRVYNTDLPLGQDFVKILEATDVFSRAEVGTCPAFHTVTTGPRDNSLPESLEGRYFYPSGDASTDEYYNETNQPYCWPTAEGWFDEDAGEPSCACRSGLTIEDGGYLIKVTPYDGELVEGEPTGNSGSGLKIIFTIPEPTRWLLLAVGVGLLAMLNRVRG